MIFVTTVFGNEDDFTGIYLSAGYGSHQFSKQIYSNDQMSQLASDMYYPHLKQDKQSKNIEVVYSYPIFKNLLIGFGGAYELNEINMNTYNNDVHAEYKLKNNYATFIQTMISVSDKTAIYAKIGNRFSDLYMSGNGTSYAYNTHLSLKGTEHAIGVLHLLPNHLFIKLDLNQYSLQATDNFGGSEPMDFEIKNHSSILSFGYLFK